MVLSLYDKQRRVQTAEAYPQFESREPAPRVGRVGATLAKITVGIAHPGFRLWAMVCQALELGSYVRLGG